MKITSVEIHPQGSSDFCVLSFRDPTRKNPFNIKAVVGLDADEISPRYYGVSGNNSLKYYNLMLQRRTIVLRIELSPSFAENQTYSDLRDRMYKMIASSRTGNVDLQFKNENVVQATTLGFVSKFEAPHSTETPEIQITIECEDPMLKGPTGIVVDVEGFDPGITTITDNVSTAPHGFQFEMEFSGSPGSFVIQDPRDYGWKFEITPSGGFESGDVMYFSSEAKNKYLYIIRDSVKIQLADGLSYTSVWPILFPGDNLFEVESSAELTWRSITYYPTYWGV